MKIKVGIFFGGPSREREISFASGRTVYDNLNKSLFEPLPFFVDDQRRLLRLDWHHIYKGSIRDFFPPAQFLPASPNRFQIYADSLRQAPQDQQQAMARAIGQPIAFEDLPQLIDVAFLALHGVYGEDGQIQQQLRNLGLPYTGSGVRASEIGIDKALQKDLMEQKGFATTDLRVLPRADFLEIPIHDYYQEIGEALGFPFVIRPARQGSSIGVSIVKESDGIEGFERALNRAFSREIIPLSEWQARDLDDRVEYLRWLADIREGLGFPMEVSVDGKASQTFHHPEALLEFLNETATAEEAQFFQLQAHLWEETVILERFIDGKEFSCIVIRDESGTAIGLPPTEIIKGSEVFDYRSKYLPGLSRKVTPIDLPEDQIEAIRAESERLFTELGFQVYARIDGFYTPEGTIYLNDPNTTSGMLPSSFFFHQAAEIGLNPSQFLTFILRISLQERMAETDSAPEAWEVLADRLDQGIRQLRSEEAQRRRMAVILGGYSFERHISVESGRNIFEKLSSSDKYEAFPVFLTGDPENYQLHQIPINLLLKDNADDIRDRIHHWSEHPLIDRIKDQCRPITEKYASTDVVFAPVALDFPDLQERADGVFIALHGRPGEDGDLQEQLEAHDLPYNGSGTQSSRITIDKYRTLQILRQNGLPTTEQLVLNREAFLESPSQFYQRVEHTFFYPMIAKPVDDGCSSAVMVLSDRQDLEAYTQLIFGAAPEAEGEQRRQLRLRAKEEFPSKDRILFERKTEQEAAIHFLEITGGMLTHYQKDGSLQYEVFEPSETLSGGAVLSLEEKFLAGEGQNITPARLAPAGMDYGFIARQVKEDLEKAARILNIEGYCRIDAFVRVYSNSRAETLIIEVNSLPGMTPATAIFHQAALAGYKPYDFIDRIIEFGMERAQRKKHVPVAVPAETAAAVVSVTPTPLQAQIPAEPAEVPALEPADPPPVTPQMAVPEQSPRPINEAFENRRLPNHAPIPAWKAGLRRVGQFLGSAYFLRNIAAMIGLVVVLFLLIRFGLDWYTHHGETYQVHNYEGMALEDAERKARQGNFRVAVIDSTFDPALEPYVVLNQDPAPLSRVKKNRTIYLSISGGTPPEILLPPLVGNYDYEQYTRKLQALKIRYSIQEQVYDKIQEENSILHFYYKDRKITDEDLRAGVRVPQGAQLDFVVTIRQTGQVEIPNLVCRRYSEAVFTLAGMQLAVGEVYGGIGNSDNAYIIQQVPEYVPGKTIDQGSTVNLYLSAYRPDGCPEDGSPLPYAPPSRVEEPLDFQVSPPDTGQLNNDQQ